MARRTYVRPMAGWWTRDPFFVRYMAREATAIFVVAYAITLLVGLLRLAQGEASFERWTGSLRLEAVIALHVALLMAFLYHTVTWFAIMPKTLPPIVVAGHRLAPGVITGLGLAASAALSILLFVTLRMLS